MSTRTDRDGVVATLGAVHIVGVGGAGMSGIARILLARGVAVSGSDAKDSRRLAALRALGADVRVGHDAANLAGAVTVVVSTAITRDNVELAAAHRLGLRVLGRAEALALLMQRHRGIAVAGSHGKTTTTSMLTVALQSCGSDPSFAIGSELNESGSNAHQGSGPDFVAEADESDGAFLALPAYAGIVTNLEPDHLDYWGTFADMERGFLDFSTAIAARGGFVVCCQDDIGSAALAARARSEGVDVRTYGTDPQADYRVELAGKGERGWRFDVVDRGVRLGETELAVPGEHNVLNATAALVAGIGLGYPASDLRAGLESFSGTRRRLDFRGSADGVQVYDDYAHHPTEIAATLRAMREVTGQGRLVVAFQAHHYYRTAMFTTEFGAALGLADEVVVLEVFAPGEEPIPGASGMSMAANVPLPADQVVFEPSWSRVAAELVARARPGDVVMTLGAGDISLIGPEVLDLLRDRESGRAG
ncbi:MAG TPA: UDP-N-acetylmuramate--L-alanine ligase [Candidatus Nanopelagicales bacterium]|nr:UDP-N-acetylmuramate--L-alanine ligase [Candidatus Nanopelagicales bacterium]